MVRLTDRPNMTLAVDRGRLATTQQLKPTIVGILIFISRKKIHAQLCFAGKKFKLLAFNF